LFGQNSCACCLACLQTVLQVSGVTFLTYGLCLLNWRRVVSSKQNILLIIGVALFTCDLTGLVSGRSFLTCAVTNPISGDGSPCESYLALFSPPNLITGGMKQVFLAISGAVLALAARADTIVFSDFGPGGIYSQNFSAVAPQPRPLKK